MQMNERGSALVTVLLVLLVFSVLGMALMGNVVNENKRVHATESSVQSRYLAENGLTYFETEFKRFVALIRTAAVITPAGNTGPKLNTLTGRETIEELNTIFTNQFLSNYQDFKPVGDDSNPDETKIKAELVTETINGTSQTVIKVTSIGADGATTKKLIGYYKPAIFVDIDGPTMEIAKFIGNGLAMDFSKFSALELDLSILSVELLNIEGDAEKYRRVPYDEIIGTNLLGLIGVSIGDGNRFKTMENNRIIATRTGTALAIDILELEKNPFLSIDVLKYKTDNRDTNVLIDGGFKVAQVVGSINDYSDINFKKLAVMGNVIIQQDKNGGSFLGVGSADSDDKRRFSFAEGLYVNKSLLIGGSKGGIGNLELKGDIVVMNDLHIKDVELLMKDYYTDKRDAVYVHGDAIIENSCINNTPDNHEFRLYAKGTITIKNMPSCQKYNVVFYAEEGINIETDNQRMMLKGGLIGDLTIDHENKLQFVEDPQYMTRVNLGGKLAPKGRTF